MPAYYWGEVGQNEARDMLTAARNGRWADVVRARFPEDFDMIVGLLDPQRASWAPMLGLDEQSRALDVGCGYGAITHSLSRFAGEVYSIEAIPERIEFTQERLRQEGINNVRLVQASATSLPFLEKSFDLIVVNGVLEWVGEWDLEGEPRAVQLRFLSAIQRMLKDNGVLIVGIENRFGYGLFLGNRDHSGIRYTSLVPRRVATFMLHRSTEPHHRTKLNTKKQYRTYTYSKRGYQKLLADAGFARASCYWSQPGYNQPLRLIPLAMPQWVEEQFLEIIDHPGPSPRHNWRRQIKRTLAQSSVLRFFVPDFVLIASKQANHKTKVRAWLEEQLRAHNINGTRDRDLENFNWALYTRYFAQKSIVRLGTANTSRDMAILKVRVRNPNVPVSSQVESANASRVRQALEQSGTKLISVPQTLSELQIGNVSYSLESTALGTSLARIVREPDYFKDLRNTEKDFVVIADRSIELTRALQSIRNARSIDSSWLALPEELKPELRATLAKARYFRDARPNSQESWIQHGDFTIENISLDRGLGQIEVFDWGDFTAGFPPLYDLFTLLQSTGYLASEDDKTRFPNEEDRWIASFNAIFFRDTGFAQMARNLIVRTCERSKLNPELLPSLLLEFLLVRSHYYKNKSAGMYRLYLRLLQLFIERDPSVFGKLLRSSIPG